MIRTFTSILFLLITATGFSQTCTPDGSFAGNPPGIYPVTPIVPNCDLVSAKTTVSLTDTFLTGVPIVNNVTLYFDAMRVNSIDGLPAGLTFETDVMASAGVGAPYGVWYNTGTVPNQTPALGCALIYGTGGDWDNLLDGGPNNDGIYPLTFHVDARVAQSVPDISIFVPDGTWISDVDASLGGGELLIEQEIHVLPGYDTVNAVVSGNANPNPFVGETYSVNPDPNVTYNWTVTNGTITSGQGTNSVTVEWDGSPTGNITVEMTDGGCYGVSDMDVNVNLVGINETDPSSIRVWPNPSSDVFNVKGIPIGTPMTLFNVDGRSIHTSVSSAATTTIDLLNEKKGVYVLRMDTSTGPIHLKLIKR